MDNTVIGYLSAIRFLIFLLNSNDDLLMKMLEKSGEDLVAFLRKDTGSSTVVQ
ncbi:MAG: hypothetical protein M3405_02105 [Acidobacteriota bacterium]|nr:hypothetical protein [Acidobacteriota bacterium]